MRRRVLLAGLLAVLAPPAQGQTRAGLIAHEWGVWVLDEHGRANIEDLARESPPFVHRVVETEPPPRPHRIPRIRMGGSVVRKPILFLYAPRRMRVRVAVRFVDGTPWLHYPRARRDGEWLRWRGWVDPAPPRDLEAVDPGHWWRHLREVGAATVQDRGERERFLFYDGVVPFHPPFRVRGRLAMPQIAARSAETELFVVDGTAYREFEVRGDLPRMVAQGDAPAFRARLDRELQERGLSAAESRSLLDTWEDELMPRPQRTARDRVAISFVPRAAYDRMLPITIAPAPTELVRVGVVIQRIPWQGEQPPNPFAD